MSRIIAVLALLVSSAVAQVQLAGDDTLVLLGQRLSQVYRSRQPGASVAVSPRFDSAADILQSSRRTRSQSFPIAIQSAVVYVNTANPVSEITVAQLRSIFLGEITNWRQLGGKDAEIHLFAGESTSGTLAFFQDAVLRGKEPYPFWGKSTTKELIEVIASDPLAIGYASFGGTLSAKTLRVKSGQTSIAVEPSMENIRSLRYPIARAIYWGLKERSSSATEDFVRWALSSRGQLVVESVGYEPLTPSQRKSALGTLGPSSPERGGTGAAKNSLFR